MKTRLGITGLAVFLAACVALPAAALARSKGEVLESIKARYPALVGLLAAKKVGETSQGLVGAVKSDYLGEKVEVKGKSVTIEQFIADENADRSEYFEITAKANKTSPAVVAKEFGEHREAKLKAGEYWKGEDGKWTQKK